MALDFTNEFNEQDIESSGVIPWVQMVAPQKLNKLEMVQQYPWGIFLSDKNAELINFDPSDDPNWEKIDLDNGWEESKGYLTHATRFLVIHQSQMEVQEKDANGRWRYLDLAYDRYGLMTEAREKAQADTTGGYRTVVRNLLVLLGKNNRPLHSGVVQFTMRGVLGASFGSQYRAFRQEVNKAIFESMSQPEKRLSDDILNRAIFPFSMGIAMPTSSTASPSIYVSGRASVTVKETTAIESYGRKVNLYALPLEKAYQKANSELGMLLTQYREEYADFPKPHKGEDVQTEQAANGVGMHYGSFEGFAADNTDMLPPSVIAQNKADLGLNEPDLSEIPY